MKLLLVLITLFAGHQTMSPDLRYVRVRFEAAIDSETELQRFLSDFSDGNSVVVDGYRAMALLLMARQGFNPVTRLSRFAQGRDQLEEAIARDPLNAELRLLRLSVQRNAPAILGYSGDIAGDQAMIRARFSQLKDDDLKERIVLYFSRNNIKL